MNTNYEKLFQPLRIGSLEVKNRFAVGAIGGRHALFTPRGAYSRNGMEYYIERAKGGFGLIFTGSNVANLTVDPFDPVNGNPNPLVNRALFSASAHEMLERIHAYDAKMFLQISMGPGRIRDGKSCSPLPRFKDPSQTTPELTKDEIEEKIADMVRMAQFAKSLGFDGVEIHGMHWGYLLDQFAMAFTNRRTDEYGGDLEGRLTIHKKIIRGIKEACGEAYPVSVRLCMKTYMAGFNRSSLTGEEEVGRTMDETVEIAKKFSSFGVDLLNVNSGTYESFYYCVAPPYLQKGYNLELSSRLKKEVATPVFVAGKMDDPALCEKALAEGSADGITLGRSSLVDPSFPQKVYMGHAGRIRPCIHCTNCIDSNLSGGIPLCSSNPAAMRHFDYGITVAAEKKKVVVIGGGVAGMEAARTATLRGHDVRLYEATDALGGHLKEAGVHEFKEGIRALQTWYTDELERLNIPVHLEHPMAAESVLDLQPDVVILAMGSAPSVPPIKGIDAANCIECTRFLKEPSETGQRVVIVGAGLSGCELALDLVKYKKKDVTLVEYLDAPMSSGAPVPQAVKQMLLDTFEYYGLRLLCGVRLTEVNDQGCLAEDGNGKSFMLPADTVILATGLKSRMDISKELYGTGAEVYRIGDYLKVGNIRNATATAYEVARMI